MESSNEAPKRIKLEPKADKEYRDFLETRIIGQSEATEAFARLAVRIKSGIRNPSGIIDSKFLAGPSGVGKTEITLTLARIFDTEGGPPKVIKVDCGLLQQPHEMSKLVGSPPGYVGSEGSSGYIEPLLSPENIERNTISYKDSKGREKKLTIILFDEFEKAHPDLQKLLLVSLDKGTIQTASNRDVDLSNSVILFTSNVGNQKIEQQGEAIPVGFRTGQENSSNSKTSRETILSEMKKTFPPEFRGRVNDVIIFKPLSKDVIVSIARIKLDELQGVLKNNGINLRLNPSDNLVDYIAQKGTNPSEGARAIIKFINEQISDSLIAAHADFNLDNHEIIIDLDEEGKPSLYFGENLESGPLISENKEADAKSTRATAAKEPIEQVEQKLIDKLNNEMRSLNENTEERSEQSPIVQLIDNIKYIYDLSKRTPELEEVLSRENIYIDIINGPLFSRKRIRLFSNKNAQRFKYRGQEHYTYEIGGYYADVQISLNLANLPDFTRLLAEITDNWDTGNKEFITKLSKLTKDKIVEQISKPFNNRRNNN